VGVVAEEASLVATIGGLGTRISPEMYFQRPCPQSRAFTSMAHCRWLRSLSFVAVVDMVEVEGCETIKRLRNNKERWRLKNERGTTTRRRFSPMQAGRGETINKD